MYAIKYLSGSSYEEHLSLLIEVLAFYRMPYPHPNIVQLKFVYSGEIVDNITS